MRSFLCLSSQVWSIFRDGAQALWTSSWWLTTLQHLSLFCKYMTAERMMQGKSLVWGIWTANAWKQNDFLAVIIPFCKAVLTSWGMRQWKCHNICNIFASKLLQNGLFVPSPFIWMKELRKDIGWFLQSIYLFPSILQIHTGVKREEESSCSSYLLRQNQQKQSISTLWEPSHDYGQITWIWCFILFMDAWSLFEVVLLICWHKK